MEDPLFSARDNYKDALQSQIATIEQKMQEEAQTYKSHVQFNKAKLKALKKKVSKLEEE